MSRGHESTTTCCAFAQRTMSASFVVAIFIMCCPTICGMSVNTEEFQDKGMVSEDMQQPTRHTRSLSPEDGSLWQLAMERFEARRQDGGATGAGPAVAVVGEGWTFDHVQLVRVPKAASSAASKLARKLVGCTPEGPCCSFPGDPPGSCPAHGLMCPRVTGCTGHNVGVKDRKMIFDPKVFSMSNIRDVADRLVSGFFYTRPHSPPCTRLPDVDYADCFLTMLKTAKYQNVASRMVSGHTAYDGSKRICVSHLTEKDEVDGGYLGRCEEDLGGVLAGACSLNFITICEAWGSSVLLLFESLPWLQPRESDFPAVRVADSVKAAGAAHGNVSDEVHDRENTGELHTAGIGYISDSLKEQARESSAVDEALYDFVSAKFCGRLHETGMVDHPLVRSELSLHERFGTRCKNEAWIASTLERFESLAPSDCRLYRPLAYGDASS